MTTAGTVRGAAVTWEELVVSALLGTGRRAPPPPVGPLAALAGRDPESTLLRLAAVLAVTRDAGRRAARDPRPLPQPCPPDVVARVREEAVTRLGELLAGAHPVLLGEWLALASAAGYRAPEELLPALLDLGRADVLPVLGERGRWLASRNPRWSWVRALEEPEAAWPAADPATRRRIIAHLRASDPARARVLLATAWRQLTAQERAGLVPLLSNGLSLPDEPLLERARRDRRIGVRAGAAELLSCLPASQFAAGAAAAAARFLQVDAGGLHVSLPTGPRDIEPVPARKPPRGRGRGAWLLGQVLAHSPLRAWEAPGMTPRQLVRLALASEHAGTLVPAWATASARQRDRAWAGALLDAGAGGSGLLSVLAPGDAAGRALVRLARDGLTADTLVLLEAIEGDWPDAVGRAVLAAVRHAAAPRSALAAIAAHLDPSLAGEAAATLPPFRFAPLIDVLAARRDMRKELT